MEILERLFTLKDKSIVITGGGGTLAGTIAKGLAQCGANIVVTDLDETAAQKVANEIRKDGNNAVALKVNAINKDDLLAAREKIVAEFGKIDGLINAVGGNKKEATTSKELTFFDIPTEAAKLAFDINFTSIMLACQVFAKEIVKQQNGSIINISSIAGTRPLTHALMYAAAKAAVNNFTKWLAIDLCQNFSTKIRVNAIAPGFCTTQQNKYLLFNENGELTERGKTILRVVPQKRFGLPEEFVAAAIWLMSGSSSFVTGSVVTIDGGFEAFSGV